MVYNIIFTIEEAFETRSWLDTNEFKSREEARKHAIHMIKEWAERDKEYGITWTIFGHYSHWKTEND